MRLLLATHNKGKVADLSQLLENTGIEVVSLDAYPEIGEVEEDGDTFLANARKKALEYHQQTGLPVLADDSGLVVDALNGAPGVFSARYGGEPSSDSKNVARVLEELKNKPEPQDRTARFVCVLVFIDAKGKETITEGFCEGHLALEPKGENGFGYDPLFFHKEYGGKTLAQVSRAEKNAVSHRGMALREMVTTLRRTFNQGD